MTIHFGAFVPAAAAMIVSPGPDTALTIRNSVLGGYRSGMLTVVGVVTGELIWEFSASVGIAALIGASRPLFVALRIAGAVYLIYLGLGSLRSAWRHRRDAALSATPKRTRLDPRAAYRQGVLSNLGNPKMAIVAISLLPQFADQGSDPLLAMLVLGGVFSTMAFAWLTGYVMIVVRARRFLARSRAQALVDALAGSVLVGLGVHLASEQA